MREKKKRRTRQALTDAALRLYRDGGLDAVTVAAIARDADVSVGTFFTYFPTKEDVFLGDTDERIAGLIGRLRSRDPREPLLTSVRLSAGELGAEVPRSEPGDLEERRRADCCSTHRSRNACESDGTSGRKTLPMPLQRRKACQMLPSRTWWRRPSSVRSEPSSWLSLATRPRNGQRWRTGPSASCRPDSTHSGPIPQTIIGNLAVVLRNEPAERSGSVDWRP